MNIKQRGKHNYMIGFSCGESIIKTVQESKIIKVPEELIRVSSSFKGGIVHKGDVCGCLLSSICLLGLKYGRISKEGDLKQLDKKVSEFYDKFKKKYKTVLCKEITKKFRDKNAFCTPERKKFCSVIVGSTLEDLKKYL